MRLEQLRASNPVFDLRLRFTGRFVPPPENANCGRGEFRWERASGFVCGKRKRDFRLMLAANAKGAEKREHKYLVSARPWIVFFSHVSRLASRRQQRELGANDLSSLFAKLVSFDTRANIDYSRWAFTTRLANKRKKSTCRDMVHQLENCEWDWNLHSPKDSCCKWTRSAELRWNGRKLEVRAEESWK